MFDLDEVDDEGICDGCQDELATLALLDEYARRLKAWEAQEGTRRRLADALAREAAKYLSARTAERTAAQAFTWEMTGADVDLRKVLRRLMPGWKQDKKSVIDPAKQVEQPATKEQT